MLSYEPTPAQMLALSDVFDRVPLNKKHEKLEEGQAQLTWEEFKLNAKKEIKGNAIMVRWLNMWLGIEEDGHVHS